MNMPPISKHAGQVSHRASAPAQKGGPPAHKEGPLLCRCNETVSVQGHKRGPPDKRCCNCGGLLCYDDQCQVDCFSCHKPCGISCSGIACEDDSYHCNKCIKDRGLHERVCGWSDY